MADISQTAQREQMQDSVALVQRWQQGDEVAAAELMVRYSAALVDRVRQHLNEKLARRFDAEDVAQSACLSFFVGARSGRYVIQQSGDLWRLLSAIARHKLLRQVERHTAQRRSVLREQAVADPDQLASAVVGGGEAVSAIEHTWAVAGTIEEVMQRLDPLSQQVLVQRLDGLTLDDIASRVDKSQRTVRRSMQKIRSVFSEFESGGEDLS